MSQNYPTGLRISFFFSAAAAAAAAGKTIQFQGYNRFLSSSSIWALDNSKRCAQFTLRGMQHLHFFVGGRFVTIVHPTDA